MNGANTLKEGDSHPLHCCPVDLRKLARAVNGARKQTFLPQDRYMQLNEFYKAAGLEAEEAWTAQRIRVLTGDQATREAEAAEQQIPDPQPTGQLWLPTKKRKKQSDSEVAALKVAVDAHEEENMGAPQPTPVICVPSDSDSPEMKPLAERIRAARRR